MFVSNKAADIVILVVIVVGGAAVLGVLTWLLVRVLARGGFRRSEPFREKEPSSVEPRSDSKKLSKISRDNLDPPDQKLKPVVLEAGLDGQIQVKNPSALSRSEYRNNIGEWRERNDKNVGPGHAASDHHLQPAAEG